MRSSTPPNPSEKLAFRGGGRIGCLFVFLPLTKPTRRRNRHSLCGGTFSIVPSAQSHREVSLAAIAGKPSHARADGRYSGRGQHHCWPFALSSRARTVTTRPAARNASQCGTGVGLCSASHASGSELEQIQFLLGHTTRCPRRNVTLAASNGCGGHQ